MITKLAAVEGSKLGEWYLHAIVPDVETLLSDADDVFDLPRLLKSNGLQETIGEAL